MRNTKLFSLRRQQYHFNQGATGKPEGNTGNQIIRANAMVKKRAGGLGDNNKTNKNPPNRELSLCSPLERIYIRGSKRLCNSLEEASSPVCSALMVPYPHVLVCPDMTKSRSEINWAHMVYTWGEEKSKRSLRAERRFTYSTREQQPRGLAASKNILVHWVDWRNRKNYSLAIVHARELSYLFCFSFWHCQCTWYDIPSRTCIIVIHRK